MTDSTCCCCSSTYPEKLCFLLETDKNVLATIFREADNIHECLLEGANTDKEKDESWDIL